MVRGLHPADGDGGDVRPRQGRRPARRLAAVLLRWRLPGRDVDRDHELGHGGPRGRGVPGAGLRRRGRARQRPRALRPAVADRTPRRPRAEAAAHQDPGQDVDAPADEAGPDDARADHARADHPGPDDAGADGARRRTRRRRRRRPRRRHRPRRRPSRLPPPRRRAPRSARCPTGLAGTAGSPLARGRRRALRQRGGRRPARRPRRSAPVVDPAPRVLLLAAVAMSLGIAVKAPCLDIAGQADKTGRYASLCWSDTSHGVRRQRLCGGLLAVHRRRAGARPLRPGVDAAAAGLRRVRQPAGHLVDQRLARPRLPCPGAGGRRGRATRCAARGTDLHPGQRRADGGGRPAGRGTADRRTPPATVGRSGVRRRSGAGALLPDRLGPAPGRRRGGRPLGLVARPARRDRGGRRCRRGGVAVRGPAGGARARAAAA